MNCNSTCILLNFVLVFVIAVLSAIIWRASCYLELCYTLYKETYKTGRIILFEDYEDFKKYIEFLHVEERKSIFMQK